MKYPSALTTIDEISLQLIRADPSNSPSPESAQYTAYYNYLKRVVPQVSDYITGETGVAFVPYKEDKDLYFIDLARNELYDFRRLFLWLPDDLLSLSSITWDDTLLAATDYRLHPTDNAAAWGVLFNPDTSLDFNTSDFNAKITVSATWGYHDNLTTMYRTVDSSVTLASSSVTTITVAASSAYEVLQYIRCESELMQITDKPSSTTLTVERGVNGTTAAAHAAQALQTYHPVKDIRLAATRLAAFMYEKRTDVGGVVQVGDASFRLDEMPPAVKEAIARRRKLSWGSV